MNHTHTHSSTRTGILPILFLFIPPATCLSHRQVLKNNCEIKTTMHDRSGVTPEHSSSKQQCFFLPKWYVAWAPVKFSLLYKEQPSLHSVSFSKGWILIRNLFSTSHNKIGHYLHRKEVITNFTISLRIKKHLQNGLNPGLSNNTQISKGLNTIKFSQRAVQTCVSWHFSNKAFHFVCLVNVSQTYLEICNLSNKQNESRLAYDTWKE